MPMQKRDAAPLVQQGLVEPTGKRIGNSTEYAMTEAGKAVGHRLYIHQERAPEGHIKQSYRQTEAPWKPGEPGDPYPR